MKTSEIIHILKSLIRRVERNLPRHQDPVAFHSEKSEIVDDMEKLVKRMEGRRVF